MYWERLAKLWSGNNFYHMNFRITTCVCTILPPTFSFLNLYYIWIVICVVLVIVLCSCLYAVLLLLCCTVIVLLCYYLCCPMYWLCVLYHCHRVLTLLQLTNISYQNFNLPVALCEIFSSTKWLLKLSLYIQLLIITWLQICVRN